MIFTITPITPVELLTLELDLVGNINNENSVSRLNVEVFLLAGDFFKPGSFLHYVNDPDLWTPLFLAQGVVIPPSHRTFEAFSEQDAASTQSTEDPGTPPRLLLPAQNFTATMLEPDTTYSLNVAVKKKSGKRYMNCVATALQKTGEVAARSSDLSVSVGVGLNVTATRFPETFDPIIDPQFTGILHYRKTLTSANDVEGVDPTKPQDGCVRQAAVAFDYIMNQVLPKENDVLFSLVVEDAISKFLVSSTVLNEYASSGRLGMHTSGEDGNGAGVEMSRSLYTGTCPSSWSSSLDCPNVSYRAIVTFWHADDLDSAELSYELHMGQEYVIRALQEARFTLGTGGSLEITYIGQRSIQAPFEMSLSLDSSQQTQEFPAHLNSVQEEYLERVVAVFLEESVDPTLGDNFHLNIETNYFQRQRRLNGGDGGGTSTMLLKLTGVVRGTRYEFFGYDEFGKTLQEAFYDEADESRFLEVLESELLMPGPINSFQDYKLFEYVQSVDVEIAPAAGFSDSVVATSRESTHVAVILLSVVGSLVFLVLMVSFWFLYSKRKRKTKQPKTPRESHTHALSLRASGEFAGATSRVNDPQESIGCNPKVSSRGQISHPSPVESARSPQRSKSRTQDRHVLAGSPVHRVTPSPPSIPATSSSKTCRAPRRSKSFDDAGMQLPLQRYPSISQRTQNDVPLPRPPQRSKSHQPCPAPRRSKSFDDAGMQLPLQRYPSISQRTQNDVPLSRPPQRSKSHQPCPAPRRSKSPDEAGVQLPLQRYPSISQRTQNDVPLSRPPQRSKSYQSSASVPCRPFQTTQLPRECDKVVRPATPKRSQSHNPAAPEWERSLPSSSLVGLRSVRMNRSEIPMQQHQRSASAQQCYTAGPGN
jgi:hypothetical protein